MATKKISELPLVNAVSGSQVAGGSVLPIVIGTGIQGTTNQISVENFSKFVNAYNATTGSNTFIGNQTVTGDVSISGRLTVNEVVAQYETSSILFSTGSTKLGDQLTDKHEFTGSTNITGSFFVNGNLLLNGASLNNSFERLHQTTGSLQLATSSLQAHSASVDAQLLRLQQTTQSLQVATASLQAFSSSVNDQLQRVYQTTQSLHVATASLNNFTASQDDRNFIIAQYTSSTDAHIVGISDFTSSQLAVNLGNSIYTSSVDNHIVGISDFTSSQLAVNLGNAIYTASVDSHIVGISTYTSSVRDTLARVHQTTQSLQLQTASLLAFTASQDGRNFVVSQVTGSLIGITNGLMAFTAALDNTYATDAQLYQLYQATRSLELHSGSMVGITNGLMAYTASNSTLNTGLRGEINGIEAYTASLKGQAIVSSSTQISNYYTFAETSSANFFYNNQTISGSLKVRDGVTGSLLGNVNGTATNATNVVVQNSSTNQNYALTFTTAGVNGNLVVYTDGVGGMLYNPSTNKLTLSGSAEISGSLNVTNGTITGSILATNGVISGSVQLPEIAGIEAYTASLKGQAIVSSSTQIQNYDVFALNSDLYNGTGSIKAEIAGIEAYTASLKGQAIVSSSTQIQNYDVFALNSNLYNGTGSIKAEIAGIEAYTASLKGAIEVSGQNVNVLGMITAQQFNVTLISSSVLYQSGSTKFGNSSDDTHEFTGSKFEVYNSNASGTMYAVVKNNRSRNAAVKTTTTNGSFIVGTSIGTDAFQYQIYDEVEGTNRVTINSQGGTTIQGAITASNALTVPKVAIGSTTTPTIPLEVYGQQKWYTTTGDGSELRGLFNPGGAADDAQLTLYKADGTTAGITLTPDGINFSTTPNGSGTVNSELLSDYEEGSWTPIIRDDPSAGNTASAAVGGFYTKVGRLVTLQVSLSGIDTTGMTAGNTVYITGLPFAIGADNQISAGACNFYNVTFGDTAVAWINAAAGTGYIRILKQTSGSTNAALIVSNITSGTGEISFTITYHT